MHVYKTRTILTNVDKYQQILTNPDVAYAGIPAVHFTRLKVIKKWGRTWARLGESQTRFFVLFCNIGKLCFFAFFFVFSPMIFCIFAGKKWFWKRISCWSRISDDTKAVIFFFHFAFFWATKCLSLCKVKIFFRSALQWKCVHPRGRGDISKGFKCNVSFILRSFAFFFLCHFFVELFWGSILPPPSSWLSFQWVWQRSF